jgi:glycosyltransferase involved in cell wall biosynthesis
MLAQWYHPVIGGEETHVRMLARELAQRGHEISVATLHQPGQPEVELDGAVRVHRIRAAVQRAPWLFSKGARQAAPPFPDPAVTMALARLMERAQPDIVHAHNWLVHSYLPLRKRGGAPLVLTLHDYSLICAKKNLMYRGAPCSGPAPRKCLGCATRHYGFPKGVATLGGLWGLQSTERTAVDRFVAVSASVAEGNQLSLTDDVEVIPNFIPDTEIEPPADADRFRDLLPADPYILFVGSLSAIKGVDVLLEAHSRLDAPPPLVLIGYVGSEGIPAPRNPDQRVSVLTNWPHAAVIDAWRRSLFGVVPSRWAEPFGLVATEGMSMGRALIASRIGGLAEIVSHGNSGLLVPPANVAQLANAMQLLAADNAMRNRMGTAGALRAKRYRASKVIPRIVELYERVIHQTATG